MNTEYATYCPEDNKLRLYVGRVPREDYLRLKKEGWISTPKQDCDFVATWTPQREDTALEYGQGTIEDEDQDPGERAAQRAERFIVYQDNRIKDSSLYADKYEDGPEVYGYQDPTKGERAIKRRERSADNALSHWSRAEYWQSRTQGVIQHAIYKDLPGVRMGRIKTLEAEIRKHEKSWNDAVKESQNRYDIVKTVLKHAQGEQIKLPRLPWLESTVLGIKEKVGTKGQPITPEEIRLATLAIVLNGWTRNEKRKELCREAGSGERSSLEIAIDYIGDKERPGDWNPESSRWWNHLSLRLAYEKQMLEGQGGTLEQKEIEIGGTIGGKLIVKTNKSTKTGRIVSADLLGPKVDCWAYQVSNVKGTQYALYKFSTERIDPSAYKAPTPESLEQLKQYQGEVKKAKSKAPKVPPLINPTNEDAERLQKLLNPEKSIERMTQNEYAQQSKGSYARCSARWITEGGKFESRSNPYKIVCKLRTRYDSVIILTDKPQKPLPEECFIDVLGESKEWCKENLEACFKAVLAFRGNGNKEEHKEAWDQLRRAKFAYSSYHNHVSESEELSLLFREFGLYQKKATA